MITVRSKSRCSTTKARPGSRGKSSSPMRSSRMTSRRSSAYPVTLSLEKYTGNGAEVRVHKEEFHTLRDFCARVAFMRHLMSQSDGTLYLMTLMVGRQE